MRHAPPPSLKAQALALLARREHSRAELREKLLAHAHKRLRWLAEAPQALQPPSPPQARALDDLATAFGLAAGPQALDARHAPSAPEDPPAAPAWAGLAHDTSPETLNAEVDAVLDWLEAQRYQSDARFVESRVNARAGRLGQARIRQELARHGVALDADTARQLRETEAARAREVWQRRFGQQPPGDAREQARQMRFLMARGFAGDVVRRVVGGRDEE